ncbi:MAG: hypothetical protein Alpg2KO_10190 [Alphaproteobacteria bacterium]
MSHRNSTASGNNPSDKTDQRFVAALRKVLAETRPMSREEMASMFDEDGGLGSEMRHMLLESTESKA